MCVSSEMAKLSLRLYIDVEKNEVLLAEAGRDFVDTLFSVLTLPVGTIVRMLKQRNKESQSVSVGCLNNLYTSVEDTRVENFRIEECKQMLLYPRSVKDDQCRKLKLNLNDTHSLKYFICPSGFFSQNCGCYYSNFSTSRCSCGKQMEKEIELEKEPLPYGVEGVFVSGRASFIITKDMNVSRCSPGLLLKTLVRLGCSDFSKLGEVNLDVGAEEVLTFIECLPFSDSPLTDAFLKKQSPVLSEKMHIVATPVLSEKPGVVVPDEAAIINLNVIMRKVDRKILYVECGEDFIDLLFTFLAVPFEYLLEVSTDETIAICVPNFVKSYRELRRHVGTDGSTSLYKLPLFYDCNKQLLDVSTLRSLSIYRCRTNLIYFSNERSNAREFYLKFAGSGFVKEGLQFMVTDELFCTPLDLRSSLSYLMKKQMQLDDIEEQMISIGKLEAKSLLAASLMTSSALSTALGNLVAKKPKEEV